MNDKKIEIMKIQQELKQISQKQVELSKVYQQQFFTKGERTLSMILV